MSRFVVALICIVCALGCSNSYDKQAKEKTKEFVRPETEALQREARLKRDEAGGAEHHEGENLAGTVLSSETSPFQLASFDGANLANATLDASFQMAGFADADLSAAQLTGNFQCACFDNANLTNTKLSGTGGSFSLLPLPVPI